MDHQDDEEIRISRVGIDASLSTMVSIFLIVLAFLATMHSVSSLQLARVGATMHSVNSAFSGRLAEDEHDVIQIEMDQPQAQARGGNKPFLEAAAILLFDSLSIDGGEATQLGNALETQIAANRMFVGVSELPRPELEAMGAELAALLAASGPRERREVEFVFGYENRAERAFAISRGEFLARNLIDQGVRPENIVIGVQNGPSNRVLVRFRTRLESGAVLDFSGFGGTTG